MSEEPKYPYFSIKTPNIEFHPEEMILPLLRYEYKFKGLHIKFLREYMGYTYESFSERFGVSVKAVKKWEYTLIDKVVDMTWSLEKDLRLEAFLFHASLVQSESSEREDCTRQFLLLYKNLVYKRQDLKTDSFDIDVCS